MRKSSFVLSLFLVAGGLVAASQPVAAQEAVEAAPICDEGYFGATLSKVDACVPYRWSVWAYSPDEAEAATAPQKVLRAKSPQTAVRAEVWYMTTDAPDLATAIEEYFAVQKKAVPAEDVKYKTGTKYFGGEDVATYKTTTKKNTKAVQGTSKKKNSNQKTTTETYFLDTDNGEFFITKSVGKEGNNSYDMAVKTTQSVVKKSASK